MNIKENYFCSSLPVYEVEELSMEETLLVLASEKDLRRFFESVAEAGSKSGDERKVAAV